MRYKDELLKLELPIGKYAVFGSGPLAIRNLRENKDIDLIVKEDLWLMLEKKHPSNGGDCISIGHIDMYKTWMFGFTKRIGELIDDAEMIGGIPFVRLKHVLEWKKSRKTEKDMNDIEIIESFLGKI